MPNKLSVSRFVRLTLFTISVFAVLAVVAKSYPVRSQEKNARPAAESDRSPVDLILAPDGSWLATVNQTSGTVSLVDIASGKVLSETPCGSRPTALALSPNGKLLM